MNVSYWIGMPFHTNNRCARSLLEALAGFLLKSFKRELTLKKSKKIIFVAFLFGVNIVFWLQKQPAKNPKA